MTRKERAISSSLRMGCGVFFGMLFASQVTAQQCDVIITDGLREYDISSDSASVLRTTFDQYCHETGEVRSGGMNVGLDVAVKNIPVKFTAGSTEASTAMSNFCRTFKGSSEEQSQRNRYEDRVVSEAYDAYATCVQISQLGLFASHDLISDSRAQIIFRAGVDRPVQINGVETSDNVTCYGSGTSPSQPLTPSTSITDDVSIGLFCARASRVGIGGQEVYDEGIIAFDVSGLAYNVYWPGSKTIPERLTSTLQDTLSELRQSEIDLNAKLSERAKVNLNEARVEIPTSVKVGGLNVIEMAAFCPKDEAMTSVRLHLGGSGLFNFPGIDGRGAVAIEPLKDDGRAVSTFAVTCSALSVSE